MRKLKLQVQISIDGFIAGTNGEMDWMLTNWSDDLKGFVSDLTQTVDTILLGKNLAMGFIPYWTQSFKSDAPMEGSEIFVKTPKVVFSQSLKKSPWENTVVANGDLSLEVKALKDQDGNDLIAYGGAKFVSSLLKEKLIDEIHLFINPVAIGSGMSIFGDVVGRQNFKLLSAKTYDCGIVVLSYSAI